MDQVRASTSSVTDPRPRIAATGMMAAERIARSWVDGRDASEPRFDPVADLVPQRADRSVAEVVIRPSVPTPAPTFPGIEVAPLPARQPRVAIARAVAAAAVLLFVLVGPTDALLAARTERTLTRLRARAESYIELGEPSRASYLLQALRRERPDDPAILAALGHAQRILGATSLAEENLRRALTIAPDEHRALRELGWLLLEEGQARKAVAPLARLVDTLGVGDASARHGLGCALHLAGHTSAARAHLRAAGASLRGCPRPRLASRWFDGSER